MPTQPFTFVTEHLCFRPLRRDDFDALYALYSRPELMQYITGQPRGQEETRRRLDDHVRDFEQYGFGLYATFDRAGGAMIGRCGVEPIPTHGGLEGNIAWLLRADYWGRGLATEFAVAMIPFCFYHFQPKRIYATADKRNLASIRVMEKAGMAWVEDRSYNVVYETFPYAWQRSIARLRRAPHTVIVPHAS